MLGQHLTVTTLTRVLIQDGDIASLHPVLLFLAGGIGGTAGWVVSYPQDLVKSILQVEEREPRMKERDGGITRVVKGAFSHICWYHAAWQIEKLLRSRRVTEKERGGGGWDVCVRVRVGRKCYIPC